METDAHTYIRVKKGNNIHVENICMLSRQHQMSVLLTVLCLGFYFMVRWEECPDWCHEVLHQ